MEIRIACHEDVDLEFELQFVLRSSPCAKEFIVDRRGVSHLSNILVGISRSFLHQKFEFLKV